jgi:hypothetical protein
MAAFKTNFQSAVPFSMAMTAFTTIRPSDVPFKNPFVSLVKILQKLERRSSDARNAEQFECT